MVNRAPDPSGSAPESDPLEADSQGRARVMAIVGAVGVTVMEALASALEIAADLFI